ncbi:hypothetical protein EV421DRAFT_584245 [Armillaria borealis]|uniref:Secreted protein n=1 Tax=Armillaria borealis TaxID=47425 RepID=A0AA39MPK7_9AGAR|nr:hypothetical protein EV421DRAFT_584245 [Armillaria borealis]
MPSTGETVAGLLIVAQFCSGIAQCDCNHYTLFNGRPVPPPKLALEGKLEDTSRLCSVGDGCDDQCHLRVSVCCASKDGLEGARLESLSPFCVDYPCNGPCSRQLASGLRPQSLVHLDNVRPRCARLIGAFEKSRCSPFSFDELLYSPGPHGQIEHSALLAGISYRIADKIDFHSYDGHPHLSHHETIIVSLALLKICAFTGIFLSHGRRRWHACVFIDNRIAPRPRRFAGEFLGRARFFHLVGRG